MLWEFGLVLVRLLVRSVGGGGEPAEGSVGPVGVVFVAPVLEDGAGFGDVGEVLNVEALVSEAAVEGLDEGCFPRRAVFDVGGLGAPDAAPVPQRLGGEFGAVVHAQMRRRSPPGDEALDGGDDAVGVDAVGGVDGEGLPGELVDDVEQFDAARSAVSSNWKSSADTSLGRWARRRAADPSVNRPGLPGVVCHGCCVVSLLDFGQRWWCGGSRIRRA